jgi:hypothetical protein
VAGGEPMVAGWETKKQIEELEGKDDSIKLKKKSTKIHVYITK